MVISFTVLQTIREERPSFCYIWDTGIKMLIEIFYFTKEHGLEKKNAY